jgi:hypothetical protein
MSDTEGNTTMKEQFQAAYAAFQEEIEIAIDKSTQASFGGSGYSVELFTDGTYRLLWNNNIGNLYDSPGIIVPVPVLSDDDMGNDDVLAFYENAIEAMHQNFDMAFEVV